MAEQLLPEFNASVKWESEGGTSISISTPKPFKHMENNLHRQLIMLSKRLIYAFLVQLFFCTVILANSGSAQRKNIEEVKISMNLQEKSLSQFFKQVESKTDFKFTYTDNLVDLKQSITVVESNKSLYDVLVAVSMQTHLSFVQVNENIHVKKSGISEKSVKVVELVEVTVSGKVTDENGEPLPGASVTVAGTTSGTVTDLDGNYTLTVPDGSTLIFSYIGFESVQVSVENRSLINIALNVDAKSLDEVLVVGYGTMRKQDITGAVSSVEGEALTSTPVLGFADALKGRVSGLDISSASGSPGSPQQIRIRGNRSITATNDPLIVLDGIPFPGDINDINSSDVKSIEVLKDASATAIYGSRGANGVILVTTKRGLSGRTNVTLDSYYGPTSIYGEIDNRNAEQYVQQRIDVAKFYNRYTTDQAVFTDTEWEAYQNGVDTNWLDYAFKPGNRQNHQISFSGGSEKSQFLISGGFFNEEGVVPRADFNRFTFRFNLDHKVNDILKIGTSTNFTYSKRNNGIYDPSARFTSIRLSPLAQPYDENGDIIVFGPQDTAPLSLNPVATFVGASKDEDEWIQVNPNFYAELSFSDAFKYRLNLATGFRYNRNGRFTSTLAGNGNAPTASQVANNNKDFLVENIMTYNKDFGKHNLQATGLYSMQLNYTETLSAGVMDLPYESQEFYNLGSAETITNIGSNLNEWGLLSAMGRFHYGYDNKFLITASMRADGSSRLSAGNKWGFFPSAAIGWSISEEAFMQDQNTFDILKLRASFGRVGNTGISPYQTQGGLSRASYNFGSSNVFGWQPNIIANPDLSWEMTNTINFGLDFSLKNGRISGSAEYYKQYTSDLILNRQLPTTSGFNNILQNVGKTQNEGFELTLNATPFTSENGFSWNSNLTASYNREKIVELYDGTQDDIGNSWFIGQPINSWFFYESDGIWQLNEADEAAGYNQRPGSVKIKDQDNNGIINADDRVVLGSPSPNYVIGWNNTFNYKNFDFTVFATSRLGQVIKNGYWDMLSTVRYSQDVMNGLNVNYWRPDNPGATYPAASRYDLNDFPGSLSYVNGNFVQIRDLTLGYTLFKEKIPALPVNSLRLYMTANNAIMINRKIEGVNINIESDNGDLAFDSRGAGPPNGMRAVPPVKAFILGLSVKF